MKEINLMEEDWDFLIILDACRYDYFEKLYRDYLPLGTLKKIYSPSTNTFEWCKRVFREKYDDIVYISTNPFINSKTGVEDFDARAHFHKIVDVWDWGWDEGLGTVHPKTVNQAARRAKDAYPEKRLIIHYLQPHGPYLTLGYLGSQVAGRKFAYGRGTQSFAGVRAFFGKISEKLHLQRRSKIPRILEQRGLWKLRESLGMPPISPLDAALREVGEDGVRKAYEENLEIVLNHVAQLLREFRGKIVITSDHGELLGENGLYGHPWGMRHPALIEIPWLEQMIPKQEPAKRYGVAKNG